MAHISSIKHLKVLSVRTTVIRHQCQLKVQLNRRPIPEKASLAVQMVKSLPATQETQVQSPSWEYPLEEEMIITHLSILLWDVPLTEKLGGLQSMGLQRVRQRIKHDRVTNTLAFTFTPEKGLSTEVTLPSWQLQALEYNLARLRKSNSQHLPAVSKLNSNPHTFVLSLRFELEY